MIPDGGQLHYPGLSVLARNINICKKLHYGRSKKCRDLCKAFSDRMEGGSIRNINGELKE
jgi:hypothetical protein